MAEQSITTDSIYSNRRFPGGVSFPCITINAEPDDVFKAITNQEANKAASRWVDRSRKLADNFAACYVITCDAINRTKIGYSTNPDVRLRGMSTAMPDKARMVALFWSFKWNARTIEGKCLNKAKSLGLRTSGEWVSMNGYEAARMMIETIRYEAPFIDSSGFLDHWVSRTDFPVQFYTNERLEEERAGCGPIRGFLHR